MKFRRFLKESSADLMRIENWLDKMWIENYTINPDLTVDVAGDVDLIDKGLTKIPIQFGVVSGSFFCNFNQLYSLQGAPREVGESFMCGENRLTSLQGAPKIVGDSFFCSRNQLTTLKGAPREVGGTFDCYDNQLTSLEGAPVIVGGWFNCYNNKKQFTEEEVSSVCKVGGNIHV